LLKYLALHLTIRFFFNSTKLATNNYKN